MVTVTYCSTQFRNSTNFGSRPALENRKKSKSLRLLYEHWIERYLVKIRPHPCVHLQLDNYAGSNGNVFKQATPVQLAGHETLRILNWRYMSLLNEKKACTQTRTIGEKLMGQMQNSFQKTARILTQWLHQQEGFDQWQGTWGGEWRQRYKEKMRDVFHY